MIETRDGYCVDTKQCNIHAEWMPSKRWGWQIFVRNTDGKTLERSEWEPFEWMAKRTARRMLKKRLDPHAGYRYSRHGQEICYIYKDEPGNLIAHVKRERLGWSYERADGGTVTRLTYWGAMRKAKA